MSDPGSVSRSYHQSIKCQVGGTVGLVQIDVTPTTVVCCEMEHIVDAINSALRLSDFEQVSMNEFGRALFNPMFDVLQLAARQIIYHAHIGALFHQAIHQVGANKRAAPGNQNIFIGPVHAARINQLSFEKYRQLCQGSNSYGPDT